MSPTASQHKRFAKWRIDLAIHEALAVARRRSCGSQFQQLLHVVVSRSALLRALPLSGYAAWPQAEQFLRGLLALSACHKSWLRQLADWSPAGQGALQQFGSLARHLLAGHRVPNFLTQVWFESPSPAASRNQKLFKHLGRGHSVRGFQLPIRLTEPMARFFKQVPDHFSVEQALRWSQIRGLGGSPRFAAEVASTRLGRTFEHEAFWSGVLPFLIERSGLDPEWVAPVIEFLHVHRHGFLPQRFQRMSDRSFGWFLERVRRWAERNPNYRKPLRPRWIGTLIGGFRWLEPQKSQWSLRYWTLQELVDSQELLEEGRELHHCVGGYAEACARRTTSIWSLRSHGSLESHRVLTIEVDPKTRRIVTALGRCNSPPKPDARRVMEKWARQEGLEIAAWV